MANQIISCSICNKRVKNHESIVNCTLCKLPTHSRCLPIYSLDDIAYATNENGHWSCTSCLADIFPFHQIENNEEIQIELNNQTNNMLDIEALENMIFQPFEIDNVDESSDLDPDNNFYNPIVNQNILGCKYYNFDQLNRATQAKNPNQLSNFCLNIRSLPKNHRKLVTLLNTIETQFTTISLTETWLQDHNYELYEIEGYTHVSQLRENKKGGGVSIFVKNNLNSKTREDLNYNCIDFQLLWIEIDKIDIHTDTNIIMGVVYRKPGSESTAFLEKLTDILTIIKN